MWAFRTEEGKREVANAVAAFPKRLVSGLAWPGLVLSDLVVERLVLDTVFVTFGMQ